MFFWRIDSSGAVVPSAKVMMTEVGTGRHQCHPLRSDQWQRQPHVSKYRPRGICGIWVSGAASGFKTETRKDITILVDTTTRVDSQLTSENITETGEVYLGSAGQSKLSKSSSYNALQVKLDRHFRDFVMTTAFTWGKGMDYQGGDDGGLMWLIDTQRNYARTDWDRTLSFGRAMCTNCLRERARDGSRAALRPGCWATGSFRGSLHS